MRSIARNIAMPATLTTLARDSVTSDPNERGIDATSKEALRDHLAALTRLRIVEDLPPWRPALRSAHRLRQTPKRHYVDPSLAAAVLSVGPEKLMTDPTTLGLWFESLAVRDVRVYCQPSGAQVLHYRDDAQLEADMIVDLPDGRWGAFEVKLGSTTRAIDAAASSLTRLRDRVGPNRCAFLGVITGGARAFRRSDGIDVVPLTMLGP
jgi:predicted AAA+ superfamily ATPase